MKSVLIVTPFFAPQSHAAVFRAHKLAKYLPAHGWKPYVLTVDTNYLYNEDSGLLDELPDEVEIIRTRYVEPTLRGVRMAFGGRERTFLTEKTRLMGQGVTEDSGSEFPSVRASAGRLYTHALRHLVHSPDAYWTWYWPAVRAGRELVRRHDISVIYSTAVPFTGNRIASELQKLGPKWVADFRDPVTYAAKVSSASGRIRNRQYDITRETLRSADAVTVTSSSYALVFHDIYGDITKRPVQFIPTGVDDALIPATADSETGEPYLIYAGEPYLIYAGEIMPEQTSDFFTMLGRALDQVEQRWRLKVVGHELLNRSRLEPILASYRIADRVEFIDHVPQRELYKLVQGAAAGILVPGRTAYWWNNHAKLVDYVGLRKPVLAVVPDPSEARSVLTKSGLGIFLDGNVVQATAKLTAFLSGELGSVEPVASECDRYLASRQVRSFVDVFESLV